MATTKKATSTKAPAAYKRTEAPKAKAPAPSQVTTPCAEGRKAHSWTDIKETITGRNEAGTAVYTVRSHRCKVCGLKEDNRRWSRAVRKGEDVSKVARR